MRISPLSDLRRAILPPFPSSQHDVLAMHSLDAVCSQGLVREGTALLALVCVTGRVVMLTVPDSRRKRMLFELRRAAVREDEPLEAIGFVELVFKDGMPYHSLHIENSLMCMHLDRCAFIGEDGHPVSMGGAGITHLSTYTASPDGMSFWPRELRSPRLGRLPDTHTLIDKPRRRKYGTRVSGAGDGGDDRAAT